MYECIDFFTMGQILTIRRILDGVRADNLPAVLLFIDFSKAFDSIHRGKMRDILIAYGIPQETVNAITMLYQDTCSVVRSPDGNTEFFDIIVGVLQGDTLAPYIFIICLDYVLRIALDENKELGLTLTKQKSRRYPGKKITDADYADDLAVLADTLKDVTTLLHNIEKVAKQIGLYLNADKTEFICENQDASASTEHDVNIRLGRAWSALNQMDKIWKSNLSDNLKRNFF